VSNNKIIGGGKALYKSVNVDGTNILLEVAQECGVSQFIHTSSASVVFGGKDLNGTLSLSSPSSRTPLLLSLTPKVLTRHKHIDPYSYPFIGRFA
jgi:nucleoside-diphosphate-sugar epimerase